MSPAQRRIHAQIVAVNSLSISERVVGRNRNRMRIVGVPVVVIIERCAVEIVYVTYVCVMNVDAVPVAIAAAIPRS